MGSFPRQREACEVKAARVSGLLFWECAGKGSKREKEDGVLLLCGSAFGAAAKKLTAKSLPSPSE